MIGAARALLETMAAAQRDGWGAIFVLWVFALAAVGAAVLALRAYRGANDARIDALGQRLDDCERKHEQQSRALELARLRHDRLQRKLSLVTGLLVARFGDSGFPADMLRVMLDEGADDLPDLGFSAAT